MTRYLLDTNIISDLLRNPQGRVAEKIRMAGEASICSSIIAAAELRFGAAKRQSPRLTARLEAILSVIEIVPLDAPAGILYGQIRAQLEGTGQPIGGNDLLIAAHTMALGYTLVSGKEREFGRIEGLSCENWLRS